MGGGNQHSGTLYTSLHPVSCGAALWPAGPESLKAQAAPRGTLVRLESPGASRPLPVFAPLLADDTILGAQQTRKAAPGLNSAPRHHTHTSA